MADLELPGEELVEGIVQQVVAVGRDDLRPAGDDAGERAGGGEQPVSREPRGEDDQRREQAAEDGGAAEPYPEPAGGEPAEPLEEGEDGGEAQGEAGVERRQARGRHRPRPNISSLNGRVPPLGTESVCQAPSWNALASITICPTW